MPLLEGSELILVAVLFVIAAAIMVALETRLLKRHRRVIACLTIALVAFADYVLLRYAPHGEHWLPERVVETPDDGSGAAQRRRRGGFQRSGGAERDGAGGGNGTGGAGLQRNGRGGAIDEDEDTGSSGPWHRSSGRQPQRAAKDPFRDCPECPEMVELAAGFYMLPHTGLTKAQNGRRDDLRSVRFDRVFAIARTEITVAQYRAFADETRREAAKCDGIAGRTWQEPGIAQGEDHPVVCVTPVDADAYARWLAAKTGRRYRVASEGEWGYASEHGPEADVVKLAATGGALKQSGTLPAFDPILGARAKVLGTHGNAAEIVADCWRATLDRIPGDGLPYLDRYDCEARTVKGGGWRDGENETNVHLRRPLAPLGASSGVGFRVSAAIE